jgi:hypothetical protein
MIMSIGISYLLQMSGFCQIGLNNNWNNNGSKTEKRDRGFTWFGL